MVRGFTGQTTAVPAAGTIHLLLSELRAALHETHSRERLLVLSIGSFTSAERARREDALLSLALAEHVAQCQEVLHATWRQARVAAGGGRAAWEKTWGLVARLPGSAARRSTQGDILFQRTPADERIAQTGVFFWEAEGLPLPRRVVLATALIPSTGSRARFVVVVAVYGLWGAITLSPPPTCSWPKV